jgi:hypothetical protein
MIKELALEKQNGAVAEDLFSIWCLTLRQTASHWICFLPGA